MSVAKRASSAERANERCERTEEQMAPYSTTNIQITVIGTAVLTKKPKKIY